MKDGIWQLDIGRRQLFFSSRQTVEQSIQASHTDWEDKPVLVYNTDDQMIWENQNSYRLVAWRIEILDKVVSYANG